jgi:hypothetical protein
MKTFIRSLAAMSNNLRKRMSLPYLVLSLIVVAMSLSSTGCSMLGWQKDREVVRVIEDPRQPVSEIICLWQPAEGQDMDGLPCRGFAGQLLFFAVGNEAPAEVGGEVMIYIFDDRPRISSLFLTRGAPQRQPPAICECDTPHRRGGSPTRKFRKSRCRARRERILRKRETPQAGVSRPSLRRHCCNN